MKWLYVFRFCLHPFLSSNKQSFMQIILPWKKQTLGLHFLHMDFIWMNLEFEHSTSVGSCSVITAAGQVTCGTCCQGLQNSVLQVSNFLLCPLVSWLYYLKVLRSLKTLTEPGISSSGWSMGSCKILWLKLFFNLEESEVLLVKHFNRTFPVIHMQWQLFMIFEILRL